MATTITILGDGAWGTAIAHTLATAGHTTTLWCYDKNVAQAIQMHHENSTYLSGITLNQTLNITTELQEALTADIIFVAIPVTFLRTTLTHCTLHKKNSQTWVMLSKGIEQQTLALASDILCSIINPKNWCVLSGPTYARDLALQQPSGFTLASHSQAINTVISGLFPPYCTFDYVQDTTGVQLYGALKNILALGMGIIQGAGYTDNTQALFFTRVFNEIRLIAQSKGAKDETAFSLAALGDSLLTGYGKESKNKKLGMLIGSGKTLKEALQTFPTAPESVNTLESVQQLLQKHAINAPCTQALYDFVHGTKTIDQMLNVLLGNK